MYISCYFCSFGECLNFLLVVLLFVILAMVHPEATLSLLLFSFVLAIKKILNLTKFLLNDSSLGIEEDGGLLLFFLEL